MSGKINEKHMAADPEWIEVEHGADGATNPVKLFAMDANTVKHFEPGWYFKAVEQPTNEGHGQYSAWFKFAKQ